MSSSDSSGAQKPERILIPEIQKLESENLQLDTQVEERKKKLNGLIRRRKRLQRKTEKDDDDAKIESLLKERAELMQCSDQLLHQMERDSKYKDFMGQVAKKSGKDQDVEALADDLKRILCCREKLKRNCQRKLQAQEQVTQEGKELLQRKDQHDLEMSNQLARTHIKKKKWDDIRKKASEKVSEKASEVSEISEKVSEVSEKARELAKIKLASLNLYQMIGGKLGGAKGVALDDTEKQLEQVKEFFEFYSDRVGQCQTEPDKGAKPKSRPKRRK